MTERRIDVRMEFFVRCRKTYVLINRKCLKRKLLDNIFLEITIQFSKVKNVKKKGKYCVLKVGIASFKFKLDLFANAKNNLQNETNSFFTSNIPY